MKVKLTLSYNGALYNGWQIQPNGITIQEVLEKALENLVGTPIKVVGSGRTDAGVHASGQVAHFETPFENIPADKFYKALNIQLPPDIRVIKSEQVGSDFDARKSAKKKTYCYSLYIAEVENPLKEPFSVKIESEPDLSLINSAINLLIGKHDFKCMCASGSGAKTTIRTIYSIEVKKQDNNLDFYVCGNGFLYNMVRILVGTLLDIGYKKIQISQLEEMLSTGKRGKGKTLPAKGLRLESVEY